MGSCPLEKTTRVGLAVPGRPLAAFVSNKLSSSRAHISRCRWSPRTRFEPPSLPYLPACSLLSYMLVGHVLTSYLCERHGFDWEWTLTGRTGQRHASTEGLFSRDQWLSAGCRPRAEQGGGASEDRTCCSLCSCAAGPASRRHSVALGTATGLCSLRPGKRTGKPSLLGTKKLLHPSSRLELVTCSKFLTLNHISYRFLTPNPTLALTLI